MKPACRYLFILSLVGLFVQDRLPGQIGPRPTQDRSEVTWRPEPGPSLLIGAVRDPDGRPVWTAKAWLDSDTSRAVVADRDGFFALPFPHAGEHRLKVQFVGYKPLTAPVISVSGILLHADIVLVPVALDVGPLETIQDTTVPRDH